MKLILLLLCAMTIAPAMGQLSQTTQDSLDQKKEMIIRQDPHIRILRDTTNKHKENGVTELFIMGKNAYKKGYANPMGKYAEFKGHWSGFYYGFVNFAKLPEAWSKLELDWSHSFAMQFNIFKYSINLVPRNNFGIVTGLGLEYQRLRFNDDNISIAKQNGNFTIIHPMDEYPKIETIKRSTFKTLYLTIPVMLEVQFPAHCRKRMYVSGGLMGGVRMHSKTKIVYESKSGNKHKEKSKGNFNMVPLKADAIARIGYRGINFWGSYTLTKMFKGNHVPELNVYTVGLGVTF